MDQSVTLPSESELIRKEVALFRALSPLEQVRSILRRCDEEIARINRSPDAAAIWARHAEEKRLERQSILDFLARHADHVRLPEEPSIA